MLPELGPPPSSACSHCSHPLPTTNMVSMHNKINPSYQHPTLQQTTMTCPHWDTTAIPLDPNISSPDTSDIDWAYPPMPPPLSTFEIPQITIRPLPAVPENPKLELLALNLPLRQFEDLQVDLDKGLGNEDKLREELDSNVPGDVEMQNNENSTYSASTDAPPVMVLEVDSIYNDDVSPPTLKGYTDLPSADEEDELAQNGPNDDETQHAIQHVTQLENEQWVVEDEPLCSYYQQQSQAALCRTMSRILAHVLPLIST